MTKQEYLDKHAEMCKLMAAITLRKNSDYTGSDPSPFANFEKVEKMGICSTEAGIFTRISDKISRLASFMDKGVFEVEDEKVLDTALDACNYLIMLAVYSEQRHIGKLKKVSEACDPHSKECKYARD